MKINRMNKSTKYCSYISLSELYTRLEKMSCQTT